MSTSSRIRGLNFDGTAQISEGVLKCELVEFSKGGLFRFKASPETLHKQYNRYLVVKKMSELFEELTLNSQMIINEDGQLVIPIEVQYRGRSQTLNIEINLEKNQIQSQRELNLIYLKEIARMSRDSAFVDKYREKLISFRCDQTNLSFKNFEISNRNQVKYLGNSNHSILNHFQPLPKSGLFYFHVKIIKTYSKNLIFGACTNEVKSLLNIYHSPQYIGLHLSERTILGNNKSDVAISPVEITEGKSIVRVEMDMNKGVISWFLDGNFLCARKLPRQILVKQAIPMISFYNSGDTVELLQQE